MVKRANRKYCLFLWLFIIIALLFILIIPIIDFLLMEKKYNIEKGSEMRLATYNMMYGMYGKSAFFNSLGHISFHGLHSKTLTNFFSRFNKKTVELMTMTNSDVIVINEVLGSLKKEEIINEFRKKGYNYSCFDLARPDDKPLDFGTIILSKNEFEKLNFSLIYKERKGGGSGACAIYFKDKNLTIIGIHLGLLDKFSSKQISQVASFIEEQKNLERKVILIGDFNMEPKALNSLDDFEKLKLKNANERGTTPNIFEIRLFKFKPYDNIFFTDDLNLKKFGTLEAYSDHLLVWADLK